MNMPARFFAPITAFSALLLLGGCQANQGVSGVSSTLNLEDEKVRQALAVKPTLPQNSLEYHPITKCLLRDNRKLMDHPDLSENITLSIKAVHGKLLVVQNRNGVTSNAIITKEGQLEDFNAVDPETAERITTETYQAHAAQMLNRIRSGLNPHVINDFTVVFPHYTQSPHYVGQAVADVLAEDGSVWGFYRYEGIVTYKSRPAILLDLIRTRPDDPRRADIQYGYNIIDLQTMVPLHVTMSAGSEYHLDQISCS